MTLDLKTLILCLVAICASNFSLYHGLAFSQTERSEHLVKPDSAWEDYIIKHNCKPEITWPEQPEYGLKIQASKDPVWWQCDTGRFLK